MKKVIYLLRIRNLIFLVVLFSFFDNLGMKREDSGQQYDYLFKAVLVGDAGVGKTQIFRLFKKESFQDDYLSTVGIDFLFKNIKYYEKIFRVQLFDTSGCKRYIQVQKNYLKDANLIVVVYDISNKNSFDSIKS